jgi:osmoprotectant transport system substrate-binding protein
VIAARGAQRQGPLVPPADLRRDVWLALAGFVAILTCGLIARNGRVSGPERFLFHAINDLPGWLYPLMWPLQQLGNLVAGFIVAVVALVFRRWRLAIAAVIVSFVDLEPLMKRLVVRDRPGTTVPNAVLRGDVPVGGQSFPSGHAVLIASLAVITTPYLRGRWRIVPWLLVAGVCIGRVYVGAHNPLDVLAGCGLGLIIGALANVVVHLPIGPRPSSRHPATGPDVPVPAADRPPARVTGEDRPSARSRLRRRPLLALLAGGALVAGVSGCSGGSSVSGPTTALGDDVITVGSFDFAESRLLAEVYSQALESARYPVHRAFSLGPREFVGPALSGGLLEVLPEYAGTAVQFFSLDDEGPSLDVAATHEALVRAVAGRSLEALTPAAAQDANAFVVTPEVAQRYGLHTLSDLASVAPQLRLGGPPECPRRPACLLGLQRVYGLRFGRFVPLDRSGPVSRQAVHDGDVDVVLLFTTDPAITQDSLVELVDDRHLQPAENVTPLVRTEVVDRWGPSLVTVLDDVSRRLTTEALREMNRYVASGEQPAAVAAAWLTAEQRR